MLLSDVTLLIELPLSSMGDFLLHNPKKCIPEYKTFVLNVSFFIHGKDSLGLLELIDSWLAGCDFAVC